MDSLAGLISRPNKYLPGDEVTLTVVRFPGRGEGVGAKGIMHGCGHSTKDTLEDLPFYTAVGEETKMCDHCRTRKSWRTELDEDEVLSCEYIEDLDDDGCHAQATALP